VVAAAARRALRRLVFGLRATTARIHAPTFWRFLYAALESRPVIRAAAGTCRALARGQPTTPAALLGRLVPLFETGWPHHLGTPWVNLNVQRFQRRVLREIDGRDPRLRRRPRPRSDSLRVGVLGLLEGAFYFTRQFFEATPAGVEVTAFDLGSRTAVAEPYVAPRVEAYRRFSLGQLDELGSAINAAGLDLLLADVRKPQIYELLDLVDTPCVALLCAEVHLRYHPAVSFHLYPFQQADYFPVGDRLYCGTSRSFLGNDVVYPCCVPYDLRGLDPDLRRRWAEREPLVVFHGRLFKASPPFLDVILGLLCEDDDLELVLMGQDTQGALARIRDSARRNGVGARVSYEGSFGTAQDEKGRLVDPAWRRLFDLLGRARLAPDPWPLAGATTRVEAYAAGAPTAHMGIRLDPASWGRPQHMVTAEHAALLVPAATAYSIGGYREICRRALYDETFADAVAREQADLARRVGDPHAFWRQLLVRYDRWLTTRSL
jgi:hypothetical protein